MNNIFKIILSFSILAGFVVTGAFFLLRSEPTFAQSKTTSNINAESRNSTLRDGRTAPIAEANNNSLLKTLLAGENLSYDEQILLAPRVGKSQTLQVRLTSQDAASKDAVSTRKPDNTEVFLQQLKTSNEGLARQRSLELSPTQILIVALNEKRQVLWWNLQADPRILRLETADDTGRLSGGDIVYQNDAELLVSLPADERIVALHFYHPDWDGSAFQLELIGNLDISKP